MSVFFSIIVPVYNIKEWISCCIDSLVNQTYRNYEIILVDDGSSDGSEYICDEYAKRYSSIKVIHKQNGGLSDARNAGNEVASGDYIVYVDGDDWIALDALEKYSSLVESCGVELDIFIETGRFVSSPYGDRLIEWYKGETGKILTGEECFEILASGISVWSAFGKIYRRQFWEDNGFSWKKGIVYEDFQLTYKVIRTARTVAFIDYVSYYYRTGRTGSIMTKMVAFKNISDKICIMNEWKDYIYSNPISDKAKMGMLKKLEYMYVEMIHDTARMKGSDRKNAVCLLADNTFFLDYPNRRIDVKLIFSRMKMIKLYICYINLIDNLKVKK